ncbi:MAG TPA: hypothetical protein VGN32_18770 [Ktedonobacterales bacterium]|jgi:hypothetical protein|nr:hypothetical protein [Ktedonobacterales bacterium]
MASDVAFGRKEPELAEATLLKLNACMRSRLIAPGEPDLYALRGVYNGLIERYLCPIARCRLAHSIHRMQRLACLLPVAEQTQTGGSRALHEQHSMAHRVHTPDHSTTWELNGRHALQGDLHFKVPARAPPITTHTQLRRKHDLTDGIGDGRAKTCFAM